MPLVQPAKPLKEISQNFPGDFSGERRYLSCMDAGIASFPNIRSGAPANNRALAPLFLSYYFQTGQLALANTPRWRAGCFNA